MMRERERSVTLREEVHLGLTMVLKPGQLTDHLLATNSFDVCARAQGGHNAGHSVHTGGQSESTLLIGPFEAERRGRDAQFGISIEEVLMPSQSSIQLSPTSVGIDEPSCRQSHWVRCRFQRGGILPGVISASVSRSSTYS